MDPRRLGEHLRNHPGLWIAVKDDEVVAAQETAYALIQYLAEHEIHDATIVRAPGVGEPLTVGIG